MGELGYDSIMVGHLRGLRSGVTTTRFHPFMAATAVSTCKMRPDALLSSIGGHSGPYTYTDQGYTRNYA